MLLALLTVISVHATPNTEALKWIERAYRPTIHAEKSSTTLSLFGCWIDQIKVFGADPVTGQERSIDIKIYHASSHDQDSKTVLIIPPTGGENILDNGYANSMCNNHIRAVIVSRWEHQLETSLDPKMHDNGAIRALTAIRHVINYLNPQRPNQIGILGTSVGALTSALALNFDARLGTGAFIVGAARFADVIAESDEAGAKKLREEREKTFGLKTTAEYREFLKKAILIEPSEFIGYTGAKTSLMITADQDTTVATRYQREFVDQMKPVRQIALRGNHFAAIKAAFFGHCSEITNFFSENLK